MPSASATLRTAALTKGEATRDAIVDAAYDMARRDGLEGLSIGTVAQAAGMSKSGAFAHFGSREDLQLAVLDSACDRFVAFVMAPALKAKRGLARLGVVVENWCEWARHTDGNCVLFAAVSEFDGRPGALRDRVVQYQSRWRSELARAIRMAVDAGELGADTDPAQFAFEIYGVLMVLHHDAGLFGYDTALARARRAYERLVASYSA
ncbi:MAG TPA: TetR/AcrR family transcriptional regulator [Tahibacter sp.]|nr:TetR/AcrR family transcriptional regulator [Tahibacter sp.]